MTLTQKIEPNITQPSPKQGPLPRLKISVCLIIYPKLEGV